jgi:endonuclease/exonuclease/phosphatase family metal-dependent hydrolase
MGSITTQKILERGEHSMKVMTFNLRFENDHDGENAWVYRRQVALDLIQKYRPSILGTQEGTRKQLDYLQKYLSGYRMHAPERTWDDTCQYPTLFYREDGFEVMEGGEFWLSKTPQTHRSKDWDSAFPRMMSYALFHDRADSGSFWAVVTHLDHIGSRARIEQSKMIAAWLGKHSRPRILMGDFNDRPDSSVHHILTEPAENMKDTWDVRGGVESEETMTHHDFHGVPNKFRMDWILVSCEFRVLDVLVIRDHKGGRYPSDHFPYLAELTWA